MASNSLDAVRTAPPGPSADPLRAVWRGITAVVDYGLVVTAVAVALLAAVAQALGLALDPATVGLVLTGSLGVYLVDRLLDRRADRVAHPRRADRFHRHGRPIALLATGLVVAAVVQGLMQPWRVILLMVGVVALATAHLRLKGHGWFKPLYITVSWLAVTVGIPSLHSPNSSTTDLVDVKTVLIVVGLALAADVLACDAADREAEARGDSRHRVWNLARLAAAMGLASALTLGGAAAALWPVPAAVLLSLIPYRPNEDWTAGAVDAALGLGAVAALIL